MYDVATPVWRMPCPTLTLSPICASTFVSYLLYFRFIFAWLRQPRIKVCLLFHSTKHYVCDILSASQTTAIEKSAAMRWRKPWCFSTPASFIQTTTMSKSFADLSSKIRTGSCNALIHVILSSSLSQCTFLDCYCCVTLSQAFVILSSPAGAGHCTPARATRLSSTVRQSFVMIMRLPIFTTANFENC